MILRCKANEEGRKKLNERKKMRNGRKGMCSNFLKSKRASLIAGPLLTNPLNSCTKLQISAR